MINWLISLINKRQKQLYEENAKLRAQNKELKAGYKEVCECVERLGEHVLNMDEQLKRLGMYDVGNGRSQCDVLHVVSEHGRGIRSRTLTKLYQLKEKLNVK